MSGAMDRPSTHQRMEAVWRERAQRLSHRPASVGAELDLLPFLVVGTGKERYGIELPDVAEVLPPARVTPVPGAAALFAGVINMHGEIRPVMDLRPLLGMGAALETDPRHGGLSPENLLRIVLLRKYGRELGLRIESVEHIRWIGSADLQPEGNNPHAASHFIKGWTKDLLMLLSTEALFAGLGSAESQTGVAL